ncbi:hypothetical protein BGZ96_001851, partial [Linnemannia gamsii]
GVWINKMRYVTDDNVTILVVDNKDLEGCRAVSYDEGDAFIDEKDRNHDQGHR